MRLLICAFVVLFVAVAHASDKQNCVGCPKEQDANDPEFKNLLTKAVTLQNEKSNDEDIAITKINNVTSMVVAGIKYTFDFDGEGVKSKKAYKCRAVVVRRAWLTPELDIPTFSCSPI